MNYQASLDSVLRLLLGRAGLHHLRLSWYKTQTQINLRDRRPSTLSFQVIIEINFVVKGNGSIVPKASLFSLTVHQSKCCKFCPTERR